MNFDDIASTGVASTDPERGDMATMIRNMRDLVKKERRPFGDPMYDMLPPVRMGARPLDGIPVHVVSYLECVVRTQVRFPRSKKKRIQKKWRKQEKNYVVSYPPKVFNTPFGVICNTAGLKQLKKRLEEYNDAARVATPDEGNPLQGRKEVVGDRLP